MNLFSRLKENGNRIVGETFLFQLLIVLVWDIAVLSPSTDKSSLIRVIVGTIIFNAIFILSMIYLIKSKFFIPKLKEIQSNLYIFLVMGLFVLCFFTILSSWLNLDGFIYYTQIRALKEWNFSWGGLMLAGHMCQGYSAFALIAELLCSDNSSGVRIMQCLMALITIYCFYLILDTVLKKKSKIDLTLYTAIFAFSPLFLGIIGEINIDFPSMCFFVWMVCCGMRKQYISQSLCAFLLCYSKETGVLLYGFYIIGLMLFRIVRNRKQEIKNLIKKTITLDLLLLMLAGVTWVLNYIYNRVYVGGWISNITVVDNGDAGSATGQQINVIGFSLEYIVQKVCQMLYVNLSWVLYTLIIIAFFVVAIKGLDKYKRYIKLKGEHGYGIVLSFLAFLIYSFFYVTFTGYRYNIPLCFFISFGAILSLVVLFRKDIIRRSISVLLIVLLLVSNFYSIDPVGETLFMTQGTGLDNILVPSTIIPDSNNNIHFAEKEDYGYLTINGAAVYNFQAHQLGSCFNKTLRSIRYNEEMLVVLPCEYRDAYGASCSLFGSLMSGFSEYYWDTKTRKLNLDIVQETEKMKKDTRYQKFNYVFVNSMSELSDQELQKYNKIYYIALPFDPGYDHENFLNGFNPKEKETVQYFSWKWDVYRVK